ncbi:MAG: MBL fold metallo-hydrolase [Clostridia bacterium]|nr:MBL fold metallo-hydrolase [Clostridia bacterium]
MKRFLSLLLIGLMILLGCRQPRQATDPAALFQGEIQPDKVNLLFLSVGQGDACLVTFPTGERIMIDTGPFEARDKLVDQLHALGVDRLDAVFVTHGHADHTGNLMTLVRRFEVSQVYFGGQESDYGDLLKKVHRRGVPCTALIEGNVIPYGEARLTVLSPIKERAYDDVNDSSAVLRLTYGENAALFMADGTFQTEEYLLFRYHRAELRADVLKVGHHGSAASSSLRFLQVVSPALSVISVGRGNEYGHPTAETLLRLSLAKSRVLRTDEAPAVQITLDGKEARVVE